MMTPELSCVATDRSPEAVDLPAADAVGEAAEPIKDDAQAPSTPAITAPAPAPVPILVAWSHGNNRSPNSTHTANTTNDPKTTSSQRPVRPT